MMNTKTVELMCMGCFAQLEASGGTCPVCGYNEAAQVIPPHQLPPRTILNGKYLLGRVLGEGGFGITYIGWDMNLDIKVAIKEYYPNGVVTRDGSTTVFPYSGEKTELFTSGRDRFVREAKNLAKFYALPGIVSVKDYFQENGTAYIVMEFVAGKTLKAMLAESGGKLPVSEVLDYMKPMIRSLHEVHGAGMIHRDISPDNMMITKEGNSKLIDFGAARGVSDGQQSLSVLLKPGFAPEEQYRTRGVQGAWTDVYALCATIYRAVTGVIPDEALERMREDSLQPPRALGTAMTEQQEKAILKGLAVNQTDRFQTVMELYGELYGEPGHMPGTVPVVAEPTPESAPVLPTPAPEAKPKTNPIISWISGNKAVTVIGVCLVALVVFVLASRVGIADNERAVMAVSTQSEAESSAESSAANVSSSSSALSLSAAEKAPETPAQPQTIIIGGETVDVNVTELNLREKGISDISALSELTNLTVLYLNENSISDISALSRLTNLKELNLYENNISGISALAGLTNMETLDLNYNHNIIDISALSGFSHLTTLGLSSNNISDISALKGLTNLKELSLQNNDISDISALSELANLKYLYLTGNNISDTGVLEKLTNLKVLNLKNNDISDIRALKGLTKLERLLLSGNPLTQSQVDELQRALPNCSIDADNITGIETPSSATASSSSIAEKTSEAPAQPQTITIGGETVDVTVTELDLSGKDISDISALSLLTKLKVLYLVRNNISDISALSGLTNLESLYLVGNNISNISALSGLSNLEYLFLAANPLTQSQVDKLQKALPNCTINTKNSRVYISASSSTSSSSETPSSKAPSSSSTVPSSSSSTPEVTIVKNKRFTYPDPFMSGASGTYSGEWKDGMPNGRGTLIFDSQYSAMGYPVKYTGDWVNGAKHGQGTATWRSGNSYTGSFKNNKKDGQGIMTNSDGSVYHDGDWKNDSPA
jgi:Leucine-rich repeat (LRR) protein